MPTVLPSPETVLQNGQFFTDTQSSPKYTLLYVGDGVTQFKDLKPISPDGKLLPPNDNQTYGMLNGIWTPQVELSSTDSIVGYIIGPQRGPNGADIHICDYAGNIITLDVTYFDTHSPWKDMVDVQDGLNAMIKIPRYWYKVDTQPAGLEYAGCPRFMVSSTPLTGFECDGSVFKNSSGEWVDHFLVGKYRSRSVGSLLVSRAEGSHGSYAYNAHTTGIQLNGAGYNMMSYQEWCAIVQLCIIEKSSFNPYPMAVRNNLNLCQYRGIQEFCYGLHSVTTRSTEFVSGLSGTNSSSLGKRLFLFSRDGKRNLEFYRAPVPARMNSKIDAHPRVANYFLADPNAQHDSTSAEMDTLIAAGMTGSVDGPVYYLAHTNTVNHHGIAHLIGSNVANQCASRCTKI